MIYYMMMSKLEKKALTFGFLDAPPATRPRATMYNFTLSYYYLS